ncbi:Uncharacterized protein Adt_31973 [Abeliophyllum distichum]|uniref:Uncharacterized protein n=1 Tax=Abeliophyllum distichum TaxID=126358 RepID=A0ABD1RFM7_9LAMI
MGFHCCRRPVRGVSSSKQRDICRGINLENVWQMNEKRPLPVAFNNVEQTMQPVINNMKYFTRLVGNQVRFTIPSCYPSWTEVLEEQRARLHSIIESYFYFQGNQSSNEYRTIYVAVDLLAVDRYRYYKLKAYNHLNGRSALTSSQVLISWNKTNRGKAKYLSVQGSKSFSATRYNQHKLVEVRETQETQFAFSCASVDERAIAREQRLSGIVPKDDEKIGEDENEDGGLEDP